MASISLLDLFFLAGPFVKLIAFMLITLSVWSWAIIFRKTMVCREFSKCISFIDNSLKNSQSIDSLYDSTLKTKGNLPSSVRSLIREFFVKSESGTASYSMFSLKISEIMETEMKTIEAGTEYLASIASASPFVGLLGMVWGVMTSFRSIADSGSVGIGAVAPGIAEALFVTAIGLMVAIPASVAYNKINCDIVLIERKMDFFSKKLLAFLFNGIQEGDAGRK